MNTHLNEIPRCDEQPEFLAYDAELALVEVARDTIPCPPPSTMIPLMTIPCPMFFEEYPH